MPRGLQKELHRKSSCQSRLFSVRPHTFLLLPEERTQTFWTAVVATLEMIVIASCAYGAFLAYNALAYGVIPKGSDYAWASVAVAALYVVLCVADNQYDLLGPEWNEHGRSRGGAAIGLAFVILLTIGFCRRQTRRLFARNVPGAAAGRAFRSNHRENDPVAGHRPCSLARAMAAREHGRTCHAGRRQDRRRS